MAKFLVSNRSATRLFQAKAGCDLVNELDSGLFKKAVNDLQ
jgi:hypothetical protein